MASFIGNPGGDEIAKDRDLDPAKGIAPLSDFIVLEHCRRAKRLHRNHLPQQLGPP